nr:anti-sigma factor antagonist [Maliibacterium massiliense]
MELQGIKRGNELIIALAGELDHHCAESVRDKLDALLDDPKVRLLTLDMHRLTFMDSSGVGVLIGRYKLMRQKNGRVRVRNVNAQIERVMQVSGLYQIIERCDAPARARAGR